MERVAGIEPAYSAWKAAALPLCYTRAPDAPDGGLRRSLQADRNQTSHAPNQAQSAARPTGRPQRSEDHGPQAPQETAAKRRKADRPPAAMRGSAGKPATQTGAKRRKADRPPAAKRGPAGKARHQNRRKAPQGRPAARSEARTSGQSPPPKPAAKPPQARPRLCEDSPARTGRANKNWWRGLDLNQRRENPADLQSAAIDRSATPPNLPVREAGKWRMRRSLSTALASLCSGRISP